MYVCMYVCIGLPTGCCYHIQILRRRGYGQSRVIITIISQLVHVEAVSTSYHCRVARWAWLVDSPERAASSNSGEDTSVHILLCKTGRREGSNSPPTLPNPYKPILKPNHIIIIVPSHVPFPFITEFLLQGSIRTHPSQHRNSPPKQYLIELLPPCLPYISSLGRLR